MILGARQRRQIEEFQKIDRQLALDHVDVAHDRLDGVVGEAEHIAGIGEHADPLPGLQHVPVFGDLALPLLGAKQIVGIGVFQPDEHPLDPSARAFLDEIRQLVAERVDLDDEAGVELLHLAQMDRPVEDRFPVLVAGKIIVGDEKPEQTFFDIVANDLLDVVRRAPSRLTRLHVDDGAERALIGAAAAGIEPRLRAARALHPLRLSQGTGAPSSAGRSCMKL